MKKTKSALVGGKFTCVYFVSTYSKLRSKCKLIELAACHRGNVS